MTAEKLILILLVCIGIMGIALNGMARENDRLRDENKKVRKKSTRHGRWDGEGDSFADGELVIDVWYCSECGHCIDEGIDDPYVLPNFCPNCGAKMDGGTENA